MSANPSKKRRRPNPDTEVEILLEDRDLLVVVKPPGLLTIATEKERHRTLYAMLTEHVRRFRDARIFIVHRLDRDTSGVLLVARTDAAHRALAAQFAERSVEKIYLALAHGHVRDDVVHQVRRRLCHAPGSA